MTAISFPFDEFRQHQEETILECIEALEGDTEVVVIEGPTGFGKSPVNIALGLYFEPSYYTTPQKSLREQLGKDFGPKGLAIDGIEGDICVLKARQDYVCRCRGETSDKCAVYKDPSSSCMKQPKCTYWKQKQALFRSKVGILTFSNLIVNKYLPLETVNGEQISFEDRNLLIVDECHGLEGQVASLHAGFQISPNPFPNTIRELMSKIIKVFPPDANVKQIDYLSGILTELEVQKNKRPWLFSDDSTKKKITNFINKLEFCISELETGKKWVTNISFSKYWNQRIIEFKPIRVDNFLQKFVWSYANKVILTSATIPYRANIGKWLERIGLGGKKFKHIEVPMTFPIENRPIYLDYIIGNLGAKTKEQSWTPCVNNTKEILRKHKGVKGLIHVSSYKMMWELFNELKSEFSVYPHDKASLEGEDVIKEWVKDGRDVLISPSCYEGVDLKDDLCRFQVLFKVPYGSLGDKRVKYLVGTLRDWTWYNNETATKIIQSYGRAVRSKDDHADFYVIDGAFLPFYKRVVFPEWFKEAVR